MNEWEKLVAPDCKTRKTESSKNPLYTQNPRSDAQ
jgi:hypothetical protein